MKLVFADAFYFIALLNVAEILPQHPSRWYLIEFLVPFEAGENQANDADAGDDSL